MSNLSRVMILHIPIWLSVLASVGNSFQRAYVSSNNLFASRGSPCLKASFDTNSGESEAQREFFESLKHLSEKTSMDAPPGPHNASALQELHRESRQRAIDSLQELEIMKATMQREHSGLHALGMHTQDPQTLSLEEQFPRRGGGAGASSALPGDAGLQLGMDYSYLLEGGAQPQPSQESGGDLVRQLEDPVVVGRRLLRLRRPHRAAQPVHVPAAARGAAAALGIRGGGHAIYFAPHARNFSPVIWNGARNTSKRLNPLTQAPRVAFSPSRPAAAGRSAGSAAAAAAAARRSGRSRGSPS